MRKVISSFVTEGTTSTVADTIADVIQVGYTSAEGGIKEQIFYLVKELLTDIVQ